MRKFLISHHPEDAPLGPFIEAEIVDGPVADLIEQNIGHLVTERELRRLYPAALTAWWSRDDSVSARTNAAEDSDHEVAAKAVRVVHDAAQQLPLPMFPVEIEYPGGESQEPGGDELDA